MKKISMFILSVLLPLLSSAANSTLSIEPLTIGAGETKTMLIDLNNPDQQVTMVEFHMQLPQGLSIAAGDNAFDIAGRTNWQKHTLYSNEKDGLIHVMLASPTNALVSGTSGALISVRLTASSTFSGGTIALKNQKIGSPDMTVSKPADYSYTVQTPTPQPTEAEPYVVYNNGTLTFYCDNQRNSRVGETYDLNTGSNIPGWFAVNKSVTKAVFDASFANARPTTTNDWFCNCKNLTEIKDISNLNTNDVTSMDGMFDNCNNLTSLDVSNFNTTKVTNMNRMFYSCEGLTSLDVSKFNTSNVTNMSWMFSCCKGLTNLNVSNFNTEKVTNMEGLFDNCEGLTKLDVSNFNTEKVTNMAYMFRSCYELTSLNMSNFNTEKVTTMCQMFESCRSLTSLDVSTFNTEKVTDFSKMFYNCQNLSSLVMNNHFVSKEETKVEYMFTMINDLKKIQYTGDIPSSIHSKFFAGVGTAAAPATLDVPAEYRDHYAAKMNGNLFFGGYFKLSGGDVPDLKDGDVFTDLSPEGVEVTFKVISAKKKTCQVGIGLERNYSIDKNYSGYVTIPTTPKGFAVISVSDWALSECALKGVTVPEGVKEIGDRAFGFCYNLETISLPETLTKIEYNILWDCPKLKSFRLPKSVTKCSMTFGWCDDLSEITVEEGNPVYDSRNNCNAIIEKTTNTLLAGCKTTIIPNSVKTLGVSCFSFLESLTEMQIPEGVTTIGNQVFAVTGIASVTIPSTVRTIGEVAFDRCQKLEKVTSLVTVPFTFKNNAFSDNTYTTATLYVPKGTKTLYQQTDGWKNFQNIVEMEDGPEPGKKVERRTVVEEGTGTWCGYCPRGMAFMKKAEDTYGDRFIGIAIHGDDPMDIGGNGVSFTGYPTCFIDRTGGAQGIGLDVSIVGDALAVPTDIDVTVTGTWNTDRTQVTATSTTEFLSAKQGCRVVYALTADGLRHSSWKQSNYYSGSTSSDPYMKPYTEAPNPITDIEFNHVLVASSYSGSTNQASPFSGSISAGDKQQNSYTLTLPTTGALAEAINKDKVYVVAIVLNPDGTVANAAKAKVIAGGQPNEKTGDLSGDGELNSTDLVMLVNMIMGNSAKTDAADLNNDGVLNSTDLVMLVNMIMGQ